jgi:hypothetical protein
MGLGQKYNGGMRNAGNIVLTTGFGILSSPFNRIYYFNGETMGICSKGLITQSCPVRPQSTDKGISLYGSYQVKTLKTSFVDSKKVCAFWSCKTNFSSIPIVFIYL